MTDKQHGFHALGQVHDLGHYQLLLQYPYGVVRLYENVPGYDTQGDHCPVSDTLSRL